MSFLIFPLSCHSWHLLEGRCRAKPWGIENTEQETQDLLPFSLPCLPFSTGAISCWVYRKGNCRTHSSVPLELFFFSHLPFPIRRTIYHSVCSFMAPCTQVVHAHFLFLHGKALREAWLWLFLVFCYPDCCQHRFFLIGHSLFQKQWEKRVIGTGVLPVIIICMVLLWLDSSMFF